MKHCFILGTRPEIIKLFSCIQYCEENGVDYFIIHTNQHYSSNMDSIFFEELGLPSAKYHLWIHGWGHGAMTGRMLIEIEKVLLDEMPDIVYVQGDTNTVLAWGLAASKLWIKVAHIEAWLRSYDKTMPEETNRIVTDHLSDYCFVVWETQENILIQEWIDVSKIHVVGNTIVDAVYACNERWIKNKGEIFEKHRIRENEYILLTTHRPSNVDEKIPLQSLLEGMLGIKKISWKEILFPIHPRTKNNCIKYGLEFLLEEFLLIEPVWFFENLILESWAYMIATDSGWIQEEACILRKKNLILRENTERPETIAVGWALLVWNNKDRLLSGFNALQHKEVTWFNPFGDGKTAEHIFSIVWK